MDIYSPFSLLAQASGYTRNFCEFVDDEDTAFVADVEAGTAFEVRSHEILPAVESPWEIIEFDGTGTEN